MLVSLVAFVLLGFVVWQSRDDTKSAARPAPPKPAANSPTAGYTVQADEYGSVVYSKHDGRFRGATSTGQMEWSQRLPAALFTQCLARCPDFVSSGTISSYNSIERADPAVQWHIGSRRIVESSNYGTGPGRKVVFAATSPRRAVLAEGDLAGHYRLEFRDGPHPALFVSVPVPAAQMTVVADRKLGTAFALVNGSAFGSSTGATTLQWFRRTATGWREIGPASRVDYTSGCLADNGAAVLGSDRGNELVRFGATSGRRFAPAAACTTNAVGPVLTVNSNTTTQEGDSEDRTDVTQYDWSGTKRWTMSAREQDDVSVSGDSDHVVIADSDSYQVRGRSGQVLAHATVAAATAIPGGRVLIIDAAGRPHVVTP